MIKKSFIAAFIVFFGFAFLAMPAAFANPITDLVNSILGKDEPAPEPAPAPQPEPEDPTDDNAVAEPTLPDGKAGEDSQSKSGQSTTQPQAAAGKGGQLPTTATPYPMMLLVGALLTASGLALLKVRPTRC